MNAKSSTIIRSTRWLLLISMLMSMLAAIPASAAQAAEAAEPTPTPFYDTSPNYWEMPEGRDVLPHPDWEYLEAIQRTAELTFDSQAQALAAHYGLNIVNVMWEDTGRYKGSAVGPNISDVTIQVQYQDPNSGQYQLALMPVIRYPNFSDQTADLLLDRFYLLVGNEQGSDLKKVNLREYLGNFRSYLHKPEEWAGRRSSLLAERDSYVLVSAQAAFLPIPEQGEAEFNPVIFNYQSYQGDPAVLTIVVTREGTSATIIDNVRDGFAAGPTWGQRLFFNQDGERASFTGQRQSDYPERDSAVVPDMPEASGESGLNMVLVIQVPLKQRRPMSFAMPVEEAEMAAAPMMIYKSDVENAVIGHGAVEGPFTEIDGLRIERDERFPVRVTVQFYKATSNGVVSEEDMREIAEQIERVYADADYVGSLVVGGEIGRPTEYDGPKEQPAGWWAGFWQRYEENTGMTRQQAVELWYRLRMFAGNLVRLRK